MRYCVYILQNAEGKIYVGQTYDIDKRLEEHNCTGTGYTAKFRPWRLVHSEHCQSRKSAMAREKYLKTGVGRDFIKKLLGA
jgi:putative endonuclease